jgi:hypothetical protein
MTPVGPAVILGIATDLGDFAMLEETPQLLLHLKSDDKQTYCIANLVRGDDGLMYAEPYLVPEDSIFARLGRIALDARALELLPDGGAGKPIYIYRGTVTVPQKKH